MIGGLRQTPQNARYSSGMFGAGPARSLQLQAAIRRQEAAQASHIATHSSIPPMRLQSLAHSAQISAHSLQVCLWWGVLISMKCAEVLHISAQAIIRRKCAGSTCSPPASRQWFIAVDRQVL